MIRHIIAAIATLLALWAVIFMVKLDNEADKLTNIHKIIAKSEIKVHLQKSVQPIPEVERPSAGSQMKKKNDETAKKLKALRERAGSAMAFKVSPLYKQKCSSCHGVNGGGIIGPKLRGRDKAYILSALNDFKSGKRKNYVMYGLLSKMDEKQLDALSTEIGTFEQKFEEASK